MTPIFNIKFSSFFQRKLRSDWASKPKVIFVVYAMSSKRIKTVTRANFQIKELSLCVEAEGRYPSPPLPVKSVSIFILSQILAS